MSIFLQGRCANKFEIRDNGLGLYLIKESARVLNGSISHEDDGDGSIFRLEISVTNTQNTIIEDFAMLTNVLVYLASKR